MLLAQNLILMGIFFTVPLFLQIVQGLDALETGVRMLPASVGLFVSALAGSALAKRFPARALVRVGLAIVFVATLLLLDTIEPELDNASFLIAMGVLGVGMGLVVSQLGNVVQSAVGDARPQRGRRPAEHRPAARLLARHRPARRGRDHRPDRRLHRPTSPPTRRSPTRSSSRSRCGSAPGPASSPPTRSKRRRRRRGSTPRRPTALVDDYEDAQLAALKTAFLFAALLVLASLLRDPATCRSSASTSCRRAPTTGHAGRSPRPGLARRLATALRP